MTSSGDKASDRGGAAGRGVFRALGSRNFRLFFVGQGISLVGTFLQQVALGWFLYRVTDSKTLLGALAFFSQIPSLVFAPLAGALADRWDRKRALIAIQALAGIQALALAIVVGSGNAPVWSLLFLATVLGVLNAFEIPFRQAFVSQMIDDKAMLPNAIALNSALFNAARLVGPSIGGVLVATIGEDRCFYLNAASYVAVVLALVAIRPNPTQPSAHHRLGREIMDGIRYVRSHEPIRDLLLLVSAVGMFGLAYTVLLPVMARDMLQGDARTLGFLMGSGGVGALTAALYLASRRSVKGLLSRIAVMGGLAGVAVVGLSLARHQAACMLLIAVGGFGFVSAASGANALIQTLVDNRYRGRVMSLYTLAFLGTSTFGSLAIGWVSDRRGFPEAVFLFGGAFLACAAVFASRVPALRADMRDRLARASDPGTI
ncbi:MAG TPA: MFS transporter [Fibrobacteria bacterium]|nr:MFS transporter [Fibrobacteria bacterium]